MIVQSLDTIRWLLAQQPQPISTLSAVNEAVPLLGDVITAGATLLGAFAGAWFAFRIERKAREEERAEQNVVAGNMTIVAIWQRVNALRLYQVDVINPVREDEGRWLKLRPTPSDTEPVIPFDAKSLGYLLDGKHHDVLTAVLLAESKYRQAVQVIDLRSRHHLDVVQPKLMAAGVKPGVKHDQDVIEKAVGEFDQGILVNLTESIIWCVDDAIDALLAVKDQLRTATRSRYPAHYVINLEVVEPPPRTAPAPYPESKRPES